MFSVTNEILLRRAPFVRNPEELVTICRAQQNESCGGWAWADYSDMRDRANLFSDLAAYRNAQMLLETKAGLEKTEVLLVSGNYFPFFGVPISAGRSFDAEEARANSAQAVAVVSQGFCQKHFGSCADALGKTVSLNSTPFTIIGAVPPRFHGTELGEEWDLWIPLAMERQARVLFPVMDGRLFQLLTVVGRLRHGVAPRQATDQLAGLSRWLNEVDPPGAEFHVAVYPDIRQNPDWRLEAGRYVTLLLVISGLVLAVSCANAANLVLARAWRRRREIATRLALGASRADLVRCFAGESMVIAILSGGCGMLLSEWALRAIPLLREPGYDFSPDARVFLYVSAVSLALAFLFGAIPAFSMSAGDLSPALKDASGGSSARMRLRDALVVFQIALSFSLMVIAALFVRALQDAQRADPGFSATNLVEASLDFRLQGYPEAKGKLLQRQALERIAALPGVRHVALARTLPLGWNWTESAVLSGYEKSPTEPWTDVLCNTVTPGYFETIGIRILEGRPFTEADTSASPPVVVISQAMARKYWPDRKALGGQFRMYDHVMRKPGKLMTVVGIVTDVKYKDIQDQAAPYIYHSLFQQYHAESVLLARTAIAPGPALDSIRRELRSIDRSLAVFDARTVETRIAHSLADRRQNAALIGSFGLLATALAAIGLFAVMSYAVTQRTREFGIRIALGASRSNVRWLVIGYGLKLGALGLICGSALSFVLARLSAAWLYGLRAADPASFAFAAAFLGAVALVAAFVPAERAVRTNPVAVLRHE